MTRSNSTRKPTTANAVDVSTTGRSPGSTTPPNDPEAIRADIERTRADLGDTVEALAAKADVKGRTRDKATEVKTRAKERAAEGKTRAKETAAGVAERAKDTGQRAAETARRRPAPIAGAVAAVSAAVGAVVMIRRRRAAKASLAKRRPWQRWRPWRRSG